LAEENWKDVLVFDSNNLEQWLEQSIPGQAWFAGESDVPAQGVISLDVCWKRWVADTKPALSEALFIDAVTDSNSIVKKRLADSEPITITSDSVDEALAFLNCLFSPGNPELLMFRDRVAVFTQSGALPNLATKHSDFIAIITNTEVEREFAPYKKDLRAIIIYPRNGTSTEVDIALRPLSYESFNKALVIMGYNKDQIDRLGHESGRSLTVLRRRLSTLEAIRTPDWASDKTIASALLGFLFAGAWDDMNKADQTILELLAGEIPYAQLERELANLLLLNDSPVWSIGRMRGMVSKIDTLYAINKRLIWGDIERFLSVAELVLSDDDPSLDLPEEQQWSAGIYGKAREISSSLRKGIGDSLVILSVHGNSLFRERLGHDLEFEVGQVIKSIFSPLTIRKLEAQSNDLPIYAEAAPDIFLKILEDDLYSGESQLLGLIRPVKSTLFGRSSRTGLLWALESVAWSPEYLMRVVGILGVLAGPELNDNLANKPISSLSAIFRCWMPQTTAPLDARISALQLLVKKHPRIAWSVCVEQFRYSPSKIGSYSFKPRWRTGAHGAGEPLQSQEIQRFVFKSLEIAIGWQKHDVDTLGDLVSCSGHLRTDYQEQIWDIVEGWNLTANDEQKAILREKIRISIFTRRARLHKNNLESRARKVYLDLEPNDAVVRNEWLFKNQWVEESYDELNDEEFDYNTYSERIEALRLEALMEINSERGLEGVLDLASRGETAYMIGALLFKIISEQNAVLAICKDILSQGSLSESRVRQLVLSGILQGVVDEGNANLIEQLIDFRDIKELVTLLLQAPFTRGIWDIIESLDEAIQDEYWKTVNPSFSWRNEQNDYVQYILDRLINAKRPRAAFIAFQHNLDAVPPKLLYRMLLAAATDSDETAGTYLFQSYYLVEAFKMLTNSGEIPIDQMAVLEYQYIDTFSGEECGIPNLEKYVEDHPELFVQALVMAYRRGDGGEDPEELRAPNQEAVEQRAKGAYRLLERLSSIPGHDSNGELNSGKVEEWVRKVREMASDLSRRDICDICLGTLFSKAPIGKDGIWPYEPIRDVIENIWTDKFATGLCTGLYNSRGVHWSGEGGDAERELAKNYLKWASALEFSYPYVAEIHKQMANSYERDAKWEDDRAKVNRRLLE
ncbi:MAG: hypothetical protein K6T85_14005, partial [Gorillibacterium sp.]|nr:hypothetical protein [Gorillibacterium sp.]